MSGLARSLFDLHGRGTTPAREVRGGIATFLTMAYILFANPSILASAGIPFEAAVAATAAAAAICTLLMGLGANFPARARARHGAERGRCVSGRGADRLVAGGHGAGNTERSRRARARSCGRARGSDERYSSRPAPRDQRGNRPLHRAHRSSKRAARHHSAQFDGGARQGSACDRSARHLWIAARARALDRARGFADHRGPALEKGARSDRHRHHERHCRGTTPRRVALARRGLVADAAVRYGLPGRSAERARHSVRAFAALDRHGGFLRHTRHGHRDCGNRRPARSRGTYSTAPLDSRHRLPERHRLAVPSA